MKTIMLSALAFGLAPWLAPYIVMAVYPWVTRQDAWHVAGVTAMCCWTPCCLLAGIALSRWASD